jgi:hypothetical protein
VRPLVALIVLSCLAATAVAHAGDPISSEARDHFKAGVSFLEDPAGPKYEQAYRAFKAAYRVSPSPKILGNLGLCAMMLERDGEAILAYERYLAEVKDIPQAERSHIERELSSLRASAVPLELDVTPPDASVIDQRIPVRGERIVNRYVLEGGALRIHLRAGEHRIVIEREGYRPEVWTISAEPGEPRSKTVRLEPKERRRATAPKAPRPRRTELVSRWETPPVIVGLTTTAACATATAILIGLAAATHGDYEDARAAGDVARGAELRDRGETLNLASDVLGIATGVAAAVTVGLVVWGPRDEVVVEARGPAALGLRARW